MLQLQGSNGLEPISYNASGLINIEQRMNSMKQTKTKSGGGVSRSSLKGSGKKSLAAAEQHAIAEQKRRKRINTHINTLRKLFPDLPKKDKPRVLMETVQRLRELRRKVAEHAALQQDEEGCCSGGSESCSLFLPGEKDEVKVSFCEDQGGGEDQKTLMVKATICCEDRLTLNRDLTEALRSVEGRVIKAEMATIGGRTKVVLVVQWCKQGGGGGGGEHDVIGSVRRALKAVAENRALGCSQLLGPKFLSSRLSNLGLERAIACDFVHKEESRNRIT